VCECVHFIFLKIAALLLHCLRVCIYLYGPVVGKSQSRFNLNRDLTVISDSICP